MLIKFKNVGYKNKCFEKEIDSLSYENLIKCIVGSYCSSLSSIWFSTNKEKTEGTIHANFQTIGSFEINR